MCRNMKTNKKMVGRPTKYNRKYSKMVDEYLEECQDEEKFDNKLKVNLPTIEGFSVFLGVALSSIYLWAKEYPEFSESLNRIKKEQQQRLINNGLSGDYNSTIAKLILSANHGMREKSDVTSDDKPIQSNTIIVKRMDKDETSS